MSDASTQIRSLFWALIFLGATPAGTVVFLYVSHFAPLSGYSLSNDHSVWADFGSYVGGLLGVWFAFLAFGGVLIAIWFQAQQLTHARAQAHLDELQRVISGVASNIDSVLNAAPTGFSKDDMHTDRNVTVFTIISGTGTAALDSMANDESDESREWLLADLKDALSLQVGVLGIELDQLVWCLQEYESASGSPMVAQFYLRRYRAIVCWLDAIGFLSNFGRIEKYFKPSEMREFLAPSEKSTVAGAP